MTDKLSYLGYDYETNNDSASGYNNILQAAIKPFDRDFSPLNTGEILYGKLGMNYANPIATAIHGQSPKTLQRDGASEMALAAEIHDQIVDRKVGVFGFNNQSFDDQVTRHFMFVNCQPPYSNTKTNPSIDVMKLAMFAYVHESDAIVFPVKENGKPSFKLENLSGANNLTHDNAHDALSDVNATALLAAKIKAADPQIFDKFEDSMNADLNHSSLVIDKNPVARITLSPHGVHTTPILPLIRNPDNFNEVFGVRLDRPHELKKVLDTFSPNDIVGMMHTPLSDRPSGFKSDNAWPLVTLKISNGPTLIDLSDTISESLDVAAELSKTARNKTDAFMIAYQADPSNKKLTEKQFAKMDNQVFVEFVEDELKQAKLPFGLPYDKMRETFAILNSAGANLEADADKSVPAFLLKAFQGRPTFEPESFRDALYATPLSPSDHALRKRAATIDETGDPLLTRMDTFALSSKMSSNHLTHLHLFTSAKFDSLLSKHTEIDPDSIKETLENAVKTSPSLDTKYEVLLYVDILNKRLDRFEDGEGNYVSISKRTELDIKDALEKFPEGFAKNRSSVMDAQDHNDRLSKTLGLVNELRDALEVETPMSLTERIDKFIESSNIRTVRFGANDYRDIQLDHQ